MISDSAARQTALLPERSFIVQAPAGSGKTGLLVYRLLVLLGRVDRPEQILAITFTRKATSEMQQRLLELLQMAEQGISSDDAFEQQGIDLAKAALEQDQLHGWKLLDAPHQLQILTIDAFCGKLTGHMPWLSRLGDRPRTTDRADPHYAAAVEQLFSELLAEPSELSQSLQQVMLELDFNYTLARKLFGTMLARRDQWLRHLLQHDLGQMRQELEQVWSDIVDEHCSLLADMLPEPTKQALLDIGQKASEYILRDYPEKPSPFLAIAVCKDDRRFEKEQWLAVRHLLLTGDGGLRKPGGVNKNIGFPTDDKPHKEQFQALLGEFEGDSHKDKEFIKALDQVQYLPDRNFSDGDWQQLLSLEKVLKALAALLQLRFRSVGECDHSEVTQRANLALQELHEPTDLALRMDYQINHILVDEFQDTSHGQLQLLRKLTAGWSRDDRHRSILLVGDPMQSIYRFREADVSLFLQTSNNDHTLVFENINIEALQLSENFRSNGRLVEWFNQVFESSFPGRNDVLSGAISYAPASHQQESNNDQALPCVVPHLATNKLDEVKQIVASVETFLATAPQAARLGILVRSRNHLADILPALQAAQIDYSAVDIQPLAKAQAVIDVMALTNAICRLDNRIAWLSLLRGPWCGLTLVEIKEIVANSTEHSKASIWQALDHYDVSNFAADTQIRLKRFCEIMREALAQRQQVGLHSIVRWAWQTLGGEQTLFGTAVDDIYELFDLIEKHQDGGDIISTSELDKSLDGLYARPQTSNARVLVSTIHKAKGLQYHTVILPCLSRQSRAQEKEIFMWAERAKDDQSQLLLAPIRLAADKSGLGTNNSERAGSHYDYLREVEKQRASNEVIRLMYVACTRAEERLILTADIKVNEDTSQAKAPNKSSLLASVWESLQSEFTLNINSDQNTDDSPQQTIPQTLLRLPSDFIVPSPPPLNWQPRYQLQSKEVSQQDLEQQELEFGWASEVATSVGIVMHDWLQFNQQTFFDIQIDEKLLKRWRQRLIFMGVPNTRLGFAVRRLSEGIKSMQTDTHAHFLFTDYEIQKNEMALASYENGLVSQYRIDRTFVDANDTRWIVDYKTTFTQAEDVDSFVDEQIAERHKKQLQKYGDLMSQIDKRPIKLAVYFPMLSKLRSWDYVGGKE